MHSWENSERRLGDEAVASIVESKPVDVKQRSDEWASENQSGKSDAQSSDLHQTQRANAIALCAGK